MPSTIVGQNVVYLFSFKSNRNSVFIIVFFLKVVYLFSFKSNRNRLCKSLFLGFVVYLFSFKSNRNFCLRRHCSTTLFIYSLLNQTATYALYLLVKVHIKRL